MLANIKRLLPLLLAILLLIMAPAVAAQDILVDETEPTQDPSVPVEYNTVTVTKDSITLNVSPSSASPYYPMSTDVTCTYNGACLQKYTVEKGDTVKAGDIVAYLYMPCSQTELARRKLNLQRAQESMQEGVDQRKDAIAALQAQLSEETDTYEKEILRLTIEYRKTELEQYRYQQQRSIESLEADIAYYDPIPVVAPHSGTVSKLSRLNADEEVDQGDLLLRIEDRSVLLMKMKSGNSSFVYNLPLTVTATVKGAEGEEPTVYTMSARVIAASNVVPKLVSADAKSVYLQLDPGQTIPEVNTYGITGVLRRLDNVLTVPETAIYRHPQYHTTNYVQVLHPDGSIEQRFIEFGIDAAFYNHTTINGQIRDFWISVGLSEGETVIIQD